jgi:fatty-acyl-CoA synthase/long-chain acyl-CoA synthetase
MTTSEDTPGMAAQTTHYLDGHALVHPNKTAVICGERSLTYAEFNSRARRVANALSTLGVQVGDRVAVMAHNSIELLEVSAGLSKLSSIGVLLNYRLRAHEIAYIVNDCQARAVVAGAELVSVIEQARARFEGTVTCIGLDEQLPAGWLNYEQVLAQASEEAPPAVIGLSSTMSYTSGTTGKPKGAYRPNGVPVQDIILAVQAFELSNAEVHLLAGPYYHSAPSFFAALHTLLGATTVIETHFDPIEALQLIDRHKITTTFLPPILLQRLCDVPQDTFNRYNTSSLHAIILGGAPCPYALKVRANERLGACLWEFYGATETGIVTLLRPEDQLRKPGSCGTAGPGQQIRLLDAAGNEVPDGAPGEMWAKNAWLAEYFNRPEATAHNTRDGYFSVGDIAYCDTEGYYYICDRKIDMIISGGVNIYPAEVEAALSAHPAVGDVAVIGVPDDRWGEAVKAVVELRPSTSATAEELIAFCSQHLADYKKPRSIDFVPAMPRNPAGKLLKTQIREPYWKDSGRKI